MLWNRNYFLRFRFRLLKVMVPVPVPTFEKVMVPVLVPTFVKFRFRFQLQLHIYTIKSKFFLKKFFPFLHSKLFYKEKDYKYQQIYWKMWKKIFLNEGNQIHTFISSSGSGTVINYGSGSTTLVRGQQTLVARCLSHFAFRKAKAQQLPIFIIPANHKWSIILHR